MSPSRGEALPRHVEGDVRFPLTVTYHGGPHMSGPQCPIPRLAMLSIIEQWELTCVGGFHQIGLGSLTAFVRKSGAQGCGKQWL